KLKVHRTMRISRELSLLKFSNQLKRNRLFSSSVNSECTLRYDDFESCPEAGFPVFSNGDTGKVENLPGESQSETGVLPKSTIKYLFFLCRDNAVSVVFANDESYLIF